MDDRVVKFTKNFRHFRGDVQSHTENASNEILSMANRIDDLSKYFAGEKWIQAITCELRQYAKFIQKNKR